VPNLRTQKGITLIELMVVSAIVGILAAIAIGAYQDYVLRTKVSEGIAAADPVRTAVGEAYQSNNLAGVASLATGWTFTSTKYVSNISVDPATGTITILFNGANVPQLNTYTVTFTPQINVNGTYTTLDAIGNATGSVDWACSSASDSTATTQTSPPMTVLIVGTLPSKWAPTNCK